MLYTAAGGATLYGIVALKYTCNIEVSRSTKVHATTKFIVDDVTPMCKSEYVSGVFYTYNTE